ncbi:Cytochrome c oxidase subunit 6A1, mitochondrial [Eumeta japonica]|uniref:Cytochrome c oxidase subunit n=1 Tax=Eumeta variegata TaxID=151549 RepID=A0A4C1WFI5_EUMVA|nr:Cytochrome c oxidase subunit 6A1, mitochondrial [Eumeta japonica]
MAYVLSRATLQYLAKSSTRNATHAATAGGHGGGYKLWKKLSFLVAFPAIALGMANAYLSHEHHERPEFVPYEYLRLRTKRFPWGDGQKSLFHNPHVNALPTGYEEEH